MYSYRVSAVKLKDGSALRQISHQMNGRRNDPRGLCHDAEGRIYVVVGMNGILTLDSRSGKLLQNLAPSVVYHCDIFWTKTPPRLTILDNDAISIKRI